MLLDGIVSAVHDSVIEDVSAWSVLNPLSLGE